MNRCETYYLSSNLVCVEFVRHNYKVFFLFTVVVFVIVELYRILQAEVVIMFIFSPHTKFHMPGCNNS
jgi:hypothetical protein